MLIPVIRYIKLILCHCRFGVFDLPATTRLFIYKNDIIHNILTCIGNTEWAKKVSPKLLFMSSQNIDGFLPRDARSASAV